MSQDNTSSGPPRSPAGMTGGPMSERMQALLSRAAEEQLTEQRQVSSVLTELRQLVTGLGEQLRATASSARLDSLGSEVTALATELRAATDGLGQRLDAVGQRIDDQAAATSGIAADNGAGAVALQERVAALGSQVTAGEASLDRLAESLSGTPDLLATLQNDVTAVQGRLEVLGEGLSGAGELAEVRSDLRAVREEVGQLAGTLTQNAPPAAEEVAATVSQQVCDRLVDELAPRVAELVLTRVAATLVDQVASGVTAAVQSGLDEKVRAATGESELRINAHVDEAILALAEALLRRRRSSRGSVLTGMADPATSGAGGSEASSVAAPEAQDAPDAPSDDAATDRDDGGPEVAGAVVGPFVVDAPPVDGAEPALVDVAAEAEDPAPPAATGAVDEAPDPTEPDAPESDAAAPDTDSDSDPDTDTDSASVPVSGEQDAVEDEDSDGDAAGDEDSAADDAGDEDSAADAVEDEDSSSGPSPWAPPTRAAPAATTPVSATTAPGGPPARISARTALDELLAGRQAWGYRAEASNAGANAGAEAPVASPLVDTSKAPAPSSRAYQMPRTAPGSVQVAGSEASEGDAQTAPEAATGTAGAEDEWFDDEQDGPRRRPWWRPGG